jgi:hypothetical protein
LYTRGPSSLVKDSMFVDYDMSTTTTTTTTTTTLDPEDTAFYEKERDTDDDDEDDNSWGDDDDDIHLGPISIDDQRINLSKNPWGTDII